jgi:molecular chaperone DnaK
VVVLADGVWSHQKRAIAAAKNCHREGIEVIAIGFGEADQAFLKAVASSDENSFFTSQDRLVETYSTIAQVLTESTGDLRGGLTALTSSRRGAKS